jgi:hypothetical protein
MKNKTNDRHQSNHHAKKEKLRHSTPIHAYLIPKGNKSKGKIRTP